MTLSSRSKSLESTLARKAILDNQTPHNDVWNFGLFEYEGNGMSKSNSPQAITGRIAAMWAGANANREEQVYVQIIDAARKLHPSDTGGFALIGPEFVQRSALAREAFFRSSLVEVTYVPSDGAYEAITIKLTS